MIKIILIVLLSLNIFAKEIKIGVNYTIPPYIIKESNSGIELDVIREALKVKGHKFTPLYITSERIIRLFQKGKIDGAATVNPESGIVGYYSNIVITYHNMVISLRENNLTINTLKDLTNLNIVAFQNAIKYMGREYANVVSKNRNYREKSNQKSQVTLLYQNKTDAIVSDINIFKYYKNQISIDSSKEITLHKIFPPTTYKVAFRTKSVRDDFNEGLKEIIKNGLYDKIVKKYTERLNEK